jgi:hypothetical protein
VSSEPPSPPQISPDGRFYWDGQRWVPMQTQAPTPTPVAPPVQTIPQPPLATYAPLRQSHGLRNVSLGCLGLIVLVVILGIIGSNNRSTTNTSSNTSSLSTESPLPSPSPISEANYKASAKSIPYVQLEKDPGSLAGTVVTYTGQVVQYDSATTTSHLRINVTPDGFGGYTDTIWLDVDPAKTGNVFRNTVIQFWGEVVGPFTYTTVTNGQVTIPEVNARYVSVAG